MLSGDRGRSAGGCGRSRARCGAGREARAVAIDARAKAQALVRSRNATAKRKAENILATAERLQTLLERSERVVEQIRKRLAGEPIEDRLVSLFDPDARPIRKGKLGTPSEFGYVEQLAEGERRGARAACARAHLHRGTRLTGPRRTQRRLARYRVGAEGRISHLKRRHGLGRGRLKGGEGERTGTGWAVFADNAETYGRYA